MCESVLCLGAHIWVTKNCETLLRAYRHLNSARVLWIDAICINQEDTNERSQQVSLMRDVYSNAGQVQIWLGEVSDELCEETSQPITDVFLSYLPSLATEMRMKEETEGRASYSPMYVMLLTDWYHGLLSGKVESLFAGFISLVQKRWWQRIWVVQESVLPKSAIIRCGDLTVPHKDFYILFRTLSQDNSRESEYIFHVGKFTAAHFELVYLANLQVHAEDSSSHVFSALYLGLGLQSSDPRDKIFGLTGVFGEIKHLIPFTDYNQSPIEVFTGFYKSWQQASTTTDMLYLAAKSIDNIAYPSWLVDWSLPLFLEYDLEFPRFYWAHGWSEVQYMFCDQDTELRVTGQVVDRISQLSLTNLTAYEKGISVAKAIPGFQTSCRLWKEHFSARDKSQEVLWRTLCWNINFSPRYYPASADTVFNFNGWYEASMSKKHVKAIEKEMAGLTLTFHHITPLPLCVTENNRLASVPCTSQIGDSIVVLSGGCVPFVLRPVGEHFRLVGHCYVHGIMHGEAWPEDPDGLDWISIR